jgi:hypothetical protein
MHLSSESLHSPLITVLAIITDSTEADIRSANKKKICLYKEPKNSFVFTTANH